MRLSHWLLPSQTGFTFLLVDFLPLIEAGIRDIKISVCLSIAADTPGILQHHQLLSKPQFIPNQSLNQFLHRTTLHFDS